LRLRALRQEPQFFSGRYREESRWGRMKWRRSFRRYTWALAVVRDQPVGIARVTGPPSERFLEAVWVDRRFRRLGIAAQLVEYIIAREWEEGVTHLWTWIIDGNEVAEALYQRLGFEFTGERKQLECDSARWERQLCRALAEPPAGGYQ
jgi:GNAT superfamily N-acetyltransferase